MDQNPLVSEYRELGGAILKNCLDAGIEVTAAFWLKASEDGCWYFYIATGIVDKDGLAAAFKRVLAVMRGMNPRLPLDNLEDLKLIGAGSPITRDVLAAHERFPITLPSVYRGSRLGNIAIDQAYLYPLPAVAVPSS